MGARLAYTVQSQQHLRVLGGHEVSLQAFPPQLEEKRNAEAFGHASDFVASLQGMAQAR